ncbi:MAG: group I intron-associated PD-(D/E)XK endonuclease [Candidatus Sulfotelmatobacter sp.]
MSKRQPSRPDDPNRPNTKRTGERSEAAFLYQASQRRFAICKPWGDSERYDFILDNRPQPKVHLFRVQIKCTDCLRADAYETGATYSVGRRHVPYNKRDIDFIAAHVVPLNIWYIIPVEVCTPQPMLRFYPHRQAKRMRLEKYREAWHLLDPHSQIHPSPSKPASMKIIPKATSRRSNSRSSHKSPVILSEA